MDFSESERVAAFRPIVREFVRRELLPLERVFLQQGFAAVLPQLDAALAARALHDRMDALECLCQSRIGRTMVERGLRREVEFAAHKGRFDLVPELRGGRMMGTT